MQLLQRGAFNVAKVLATKHYTQSGGTLAPWKRPLSTPGPHTRYPSLRTAHCPLPTSHTLVAAPHCQRPAQRTYADHLHLPPVVHLDGQRLLREGLTDDATVETPLQLAAFGIVEDADVLVAPDAQQPHNLQRLRENGWGQTLVANM